MVTQVHAVTWEKCIETFDRMCSGFTEHQGKTNFWYRGHAKECWSLKTTLERYSKQDFSFESYYEVASRILPEVQGLSPNQFHIPSLKEFSTHSRQFDFYENFTPSDYFSYLRNFGFPSPLMDWSKSLYVAAYMAFADPVADGNNAAIYLFCDRVGLSDKRYQEGEPMIWLLDNYTKIHTRHHRQQSGYTVCGCFKTDPLDNKKRWYFVPHDQSISLERSKLFNGTPRNSLYKMTIPITERSKILNYLDKHNINAFSLFDSEEGLLKTLAFREVSA